MLARSAGPPPPPDACRGRLDTQSRAPPAWCYSLDVASCARYFSIVSFETRACEVRDGRCVAGAVCRTNCNGTVAYAFLSDGALPLWPVWHKYFAGCPAGSSIALVHSQDRKATLRSMATQRRPTAPPWSIRVLDPAETINGSLRFSWKMVRAMFALVRRSQRVRAPNGCVPQWIHFSSASCAPIRPCSAVHTFFKGHAGASFVPSQVPPDSEETGGDSALENATSSIRQHRLQLGVRKGVQWVTLWGADAARVAGDEEALRQAWAGAGDAWEDGTVPRYVLAPAYQAPREECRRYQIGSGRAALVRCFNSSVSLSEVNGAVDELLWPNELARRGLPMHDRSLTWSSWNRNVLKQVEDSTLHGLEVTPSNRTRKQLRPVAFQWKGSPIALDSAHAIGWACSQALEGGFAFARKFVGMRAKAIDGLQRCRRMSHKQKPGVATLAGGRYKVPKFRGTPKWRDPALLGRPSGAPKRAPTTNGSSTAWRRRWELLFGMSNVDSYKGVFWATLADGVETECCVFLGYTPSLQGCVEAADAKEPELFLAWELHGASGPRSVTWYRSEVHESRISPHIGKGACYAVVDGSWAPVVTRRGGHALADSAKLREHALQHVKPWRQDTGKLRKFGAGGRYREAQ